MLPVPRPNIEGIRPYKPGRPIEQVVRELGIKGPVIKLASNENPLGPSPRALSALRRVLPELHYYPEDSGHLLRTKLGATHKVDPVSIILGNGSVEIIMMACLAYLEPGDELVMSDHSFMMARNGAAIMNARLVGDAIQTISPLCCAAIEIHGLAHGLRRCLVRCLERRGVGAH